MPDPDRLLRTIAQAAEAFRTTPGRKGRLIELQDAGEVLVAGDLHGNLANLRRLLLRTDLAHQPGRHLVLQELVHGGFYYPDGSDKSHQLLDILAALKCQYPGRVHMLLGNHELAQWQGRWIAKAAHADVDLSAVFHKGVETAYGDRAEVIYAAYLELFAAMALAVRTVNRVFLSHSLPGPSRLEAFDPMALEKDTADPADFAIGGSVHSLLWGRSTSLVGVEGFLKKVDADYLITGHIPCPNGFDIPNDRQVILDCIGEPAAFCLFPTGRPLSHDELVGCVQLL